MVALDETGPDDLGQYGQKGARPDMPDGDDGAALEVMVAFRGRAGPAPEGSLQASRSSTCASPSRYLRAISALQSSAVRWSRYRRRETCCS